MIANVISFPRELAGGAPGVREWRPLGDVAVGIVGRVASRSGVASSAHTILREEGGRQPATTGDAVPAE